MAKKTAKVETQEIASVRKDIDIFAGWGLRMENPDPVLNSQAAGKGMKLYDEVLRDTHTGSVLQTRILAVTGREWEIIPPEDAGPGMDDICAFLRKTFLATNFDKARQEMLKAIVYGHYPAEVTWKASASAWTIDKIIPKHPRRFIFTPERELRLLTPQNMVDGEQLPQRKFISFTYGSTDNPYGDGLGQSLWWPCWFKKHGIKFWLVFLEKFGMPTGVGKYPPGTDPAMQKKLLEAIDSFQTDTGVIIPDNMQLELMEASRTGQASYQGLCDYMDRAISKRVLSQTLTTEVKGEGSYAASKTHEGVRMEIVKSDADYLCEALNGSVVKWLVDLNFGPQAEYPKMWIRVEDEEDLQPLAERDKILWEMGVEFPSSYFYETYGIPEPQAGEKTLKNARPPGAAALPASHSGQIEKPQAGFSEPEETLFPDQAAIDAPAAPGPDVISEALQPVMELIRQGHSYQDIENRLTTVWPAMKSSQLEELMQRAVFAAQAWGRLHA